MNFDWDPQKAAENEKEHGVSFEEVSTVLRDRLSITEVDETHSTPDEPRFRTVGQSSRGKTLVVIHSDRGEDTIRIISTWKASRGQRKKYEEKKPHQSSE